MKLENRIFAHPKGDGTYAWSAERLSESTMSYISLEFVENLWEEYRGDPEFIKKLRDESK